MECAEHDRKIPVADLVEPEPPPPPVVVPAGAVGRTAARDLEGSFITRVERLVLGAAAVHHPVEDRFYDNVEATRAFTVLDTGAEDVKRLLRDARVPAPGAVFRELPLDKAFVCEVGARDFFGRKIPKVAVAAVALSPLEELVRVGYASRPMSAEDLLAAVRELALSPDVFYYVAGFSTTGWTPDSRRLLGNGPNWVAGLVERDAYGWRFHPAEDPRWREGRAFFLLDSPEERVGAVARYVADHVFELLMDQLSEVRVAEGTGVDAATVNQAFEELCRKDRFLRRVVADGRARLVRTY